MESAKSPSGFGWPHYAVAGIGLLTFFLLIIAGKTALQKPEKPAAMTQSAEKPEKAKGGEENSSLDNVNLLGMIPPLPTEGPVAALLDSLKASAGRPEKRPAAIKKLVEGLRDSGRLDAAAIYAGELATLEPNAQNQLVAGALYNNAGNLPPINTDSTLFARWNEQARSFLEKAVAADSMNQDALIELGLAYVNARNPQYSMQGIQKLKKVLEINPENGEANYHLGVFSMRTGQFEKAVERLKKVPKGHPGYESAQEMLKEAQAELKTK